MRCGRSRWTSSASALSSAKVASGVSTAIRLRSQMLGCSSRKNAMPCLVGTERVAIRVWTTRSNARIRAKWSALLVVFVVARAADDDPVGLDGHLDRSVARPVLGVDRVVLDGGVEPQAVALLAVVERALQGAAARAGGAPAAATPTAAATTTARAAAVVLVVLVGLRVVLVLAGLGGGRSGLGRLGLLGLQLGGDEGVVLGAKVDLVVEIDDRSRGLALALRGEFVPAFERLDLLYGHLKLVGDPGIRSALPNPATNLVEMWTERASSHERGGP